MNPAAEPMQVESSGGSTVAGGGIGAGVDVVYSTPLPIFVPISVFQDDNGNLLDVLAVYCHTAILGKSGGGKTHLVCHLIMQWAPIKGWNHGWVVAIMPRPVRNRPNTAHHAMYTSHPPCCSSRPHTTHPHNATCSVLP
jgi:hypothetical protein